MGKKIKGDNLVNIAEDIKQDKGKYANAKNVIADVDNKADAKVLSDMVHEYDNIDKKIKEPEEKTKKGTLDDDIPRKTGGRLNGGVFLLDESAPTKGDMILGGAVVSVFLAGVIAIGYVGWKGYKLVRRFI